MGVDGAASRTMMIALPWRGAHLVEMTRRSVARADEIRRAIPNRLMHVARKAWPLLLVMVGPGALQAQVELRGRVLTATGDPIPGASILLSSVGYSVRSDSTGR